MESRLVPWFPLLFLAAGAAFAQDGSQPADVLVWRCWYDQNVHITCLIDSPPRPGEGSGLRQPSRLPSIVQKLRTDPEAFRNRFIHIPLHTPPYDMEFTFALARASVCGSRPDCMVNFSSTPPNPFEIARILEKYPATAERPEDGGLMDAAHDGED